MVSPDSVRTPVTCGTPGDRLGTGDQGFGGGLVADDHTRGLRRRRRVSKLDEWTPAGRQRLEPAEVAVCVGPVGQEAGRGHGRIEPEGAHRLQLLEHDRQVFLDQRPAARLHIMHKSKLPDAPSPPALPCRLRIAWWGFVPVEHHDLQPLLRQQDRRRQTGRSPTQHHYVCHRIPLCRPGPTVRYPGRPDRS
jgi:hypothetical protein